MKIGLGFLLALLCACTTAPKVVTPTAGAIDPETTKLAKSNNLNVWAECNSENPSAVAFELMISNSGNKSHKIRTDSFSAITKEGKALKITRSRYDCFHYLDSKKNLIENAEKCDKEILLAPNERITMRYWIALTSDAFILPGLFSAVYVHANSSIQINFANINDKPWSAQCNTL